MPSERAVELVVLLDAPELGQTRPVGVLTRWPGARGAISFAYAASWLTGRRAFAIDPTLPLTDGLIYMPERTVPPVLADTSPDAWGQALMIRREGRNLDPWDFLVGVADETRMGALRLRRGIEGAFVSDRDPAVPPVASLRDLQAAARRFEEDPDAPISDASIALLIAPGSSLGGARPKANFRTPDGSLWIAKFPARTDRQDAGAWEHVYAQVARTAGISVAETDLLRVAGPARTFVTRRFDRDAAGARRLFASAETLTGRRRGEAADYADIARAITDHGAARTVRDDLAQMYRRVAFNVLAGNRDDHLRNHGFLRTSEGWRLAPAFDLNPAREAREHALAVNGVSFAPTATDVLASRVHFGLGGGVARAIIDEVAAAVARWRSLATIAGIGTAEQDRVGVAFAALESVEALARQ